MKLRQLLSMLQSTAKEIGSADPMICGGTPRDKVLGRLDNIADLDITTGDKTVDYLSQEFYIKFRKQFNVTRKTMEDGHSSIFIGKLKVDFSSNFMVHNIDYILNQMGLSEPTNMQREMFSRDFTCNSLLLTLDLKNILDPTGHGLQDIKDKKIKTCLSPEITLTANRNRVIRSIYLACKLGFDIDQAIIDYVKKNPQTVKISTEKSLTDKVNEAFQRDGDKAAYYITKMHLWDYIPITEIVTPYYRKSVAVPLKTAYFQGGGGPNEPTPGKKKYNSEPALVQQPRFKEPFYYNYDTYDVPGKHGPGPGWHSMQNYKSIQEFLKSRRKKLKGKYVAEDSWILNDGSKTKKKPKIASLLQKIANDSNSIDFPVDEQVNKYDMIYPSEEIYHSPRLIGPNGTTDLSTFPGNTGETDFSSYMSSVDIAGSYSRLPLPDQENRSGEALNFGRDYTEDAEISSILDPQDLKLIMDKYIEPAESDLFGLPDGIDPISDLDAENTINDENPYTGTSDIGTQIYEDKWNI